MLTDFVRPQLLGMSNLNLEEFIQQEKGEDVSKNIAALTVLISVMAGNLENGVSTFHAYIKNFAFFPFLFVKHTHIHISHCVFVCSIR